MNDAQRCRCLVWHPQTEEERALVVSRLQNARESGDRHALMINTMALTGRCPARDGGTS
jgi:hypothetical protein